MSLSFCGKLKQVAVKRDVSGTILRLVHIRCRQWGCEFCAEKNKKVWRAHLLEKLNHEPLKNMQWCFITLTAHEFAQSPEKSVKNLKVAWEKLYHRIKYHWRNQSITYAMLYEPHKTGSLHIHAIINLEVEGDNVLKTKWRKVGDGREYYKIWQHQKLTNWLSDNMRECGAGYIAHGVKIDNPNPGLVVAYIVKYMSKQNTGWHGYPKYFHRIAVTRDIGSPKPPKKEKGWSKRHAVHVTEIAKYQHLVDLNTGEIVTVDSVLENDETFYPYATD